MRKKILIIGRPGSGRHTLAQIISVEIGLPVFINETYPE